MPLSHLNPEQFAAASAPFGHNLIIASAGTGKTSTIVARIAHLLSSGVEPSKILLLTFTNKAAAEMLSRLAKKFDKSVISSVSAGTFHASAYALLRANGFDITLKQPSELKLLLKSIVGQRKFHHISDIGAFSKEKSIVIIDKNGKEIKEIPYTGTLLTDLEFLPNGELVGAGYDNNLYFWEAK